MSVFGVPDMGTEANRSQCHEPAGRPLRFVRVDPEAGAVAGPAIAVAPAEVSVWAYTLDEPDAVVGTWSRFLAPEEMARADRFLRREDRGRWIVARAVLRHVLSRCCGVHPVGITFRYGPEGKPALALPGGTPEPITFNLAHSQGRALLAVARGIAIGVDLEQLRENFDPLPIAHRFFYGSERAAIVAAPVTRQRAAFFRHWVAKESVLKAQGIGLAFPLDRFRVMFESDDEVARVESWDPRRLAADWVVRMLQLEGGWQGAVAAPGKGWTVRYAT